MCMAEVAQSENEEPGSEIGIRCGECGTLVDKTYQRGLCKPCLVHSFKNVVEVIDYYRAGGGESATPR